MDGSGVHWRPPRDDKATREFASGTPAAEESTYDPLSSNMGWPLSTHTLLAVTLGGSGQRR